MWAWADRLRSGARRRLPSGRDARHDLVAGLPGAIASVPDGMASGILAGVSPVQGLYASMVGPFFGGLTSSTRLMVVTTTSAAALATGSALASVPAERRSGAVALLALLAGCVMLVAALLRLGRYTRFVSHSVMTGFLTGIAVNIVFGQIPDLTGAPSQGPFPLAKAVNVIVHPGTINLAALATGLAAAAIIVGLGRTPLGSFGSLVALIVPTLAVALFHGDSVERVRDAGDIPQGVPLPGLPDFGDFSVPLVTGALAVAVIVLVQGAGVAEAAPNADGSRSNPNRDFLAAGVANLASGFWRGQPVGGSLGQTAVNVQAGSRTRWGAVFSGAWMLVILVAFSGVIGMVAQPTLAALLIVAGIGSIRPGQIMMIWRTGLTSQLAVAVTFLATLFLPVAEAVGVGVMLSLILQLNREALDLRVVRLVPGPDGWREEAAPKAVAAGGVLVLDVYGSLLYAGARTFESRLPDPGGSGRTAVVIRLRGRTELGSTFFLVVETYARQLGQRGGRLFLSGVDPKLHAQAASTARNQPGSEFIEVLDATPVLQQSTERAYRRAKEWVRAE